MNIVHRVTGYNKVTERLEVEFDVPSERLGEVRNLVKAPESQLINYGSLPIETSAAWAVANSLQFPMKVDHYDWFLEPFAEVS